MKISVAPRSLTYWFDRGSNSPQSPPVQSPPDPAGLRPPNPPKLVQKFWLKRLWMRALISSFFESFPESSSSISLPCPLSPYPSPGTVVKL